MSDRTPRDVEDIVTEVKTMSLPQRLRFAAELLERADATKSLQLKRVAHELIHLTHQQVAAQILLAGG